MQSIVLYSIPFRYIQLYSIQTQKNLDLEIPLRGKGDISTIRYRCGRFCSTEDKTSRQSRKWNAPACLPDRVRAIQLTFDPKTWKENKATHQGVKHFEAVSLRTLVQDAEQSVQGVLEELCTNGKIK